MPFYGRNKRRAAKTYADLLQNSAFDDSVDVVDGFAFNGPRAIEKKVRYARQQRLGGNDLGGWSGRLWTEVALESGWESDLCEVGETSCVGFGLLCRIWHLGETLSCFIVTVCGFDSGFPYPPYLNGRMVSHATVFLLLSAAFSPGFTTLSLLPCGSVLADSSTDGITDGITARSKCSSVTCR